MTTARSLLAALLLACAPLARAETASTLDERIRVLRAAATTGSSADRATRLVELTEALLARLAADGADTAVLFALPTDEQRERAGAHAQEALRASDLARAAIDEAVALLESRPDFAESDEAQAARSRLAVELGELRLPMARARAAALVSALADAAPERARLLAIVNESIGGAVLDRPDAEAERLVLAGLSHPGALEDALRLAPSGSRAALEATLALALAAAQRTDGGPAQAKAWLRRRAEQPPFQNGPRADPALQALAAGALVRIGLIESERAGIGPLRAAALEEAFAPLARFIARDDLGVTYEARRAMALARAGAVPLPGAARDLPALVLVARAHTLGGAPGGASEAIALLDALIARAPATLGAIAPEAHWERALLTDSKARRAGAGSAAVAMGAWLDFATEFPRHPGAPAAISRAAEIAMALAPALGRAGAGAEGDMPVVGDATRRALRAAIAQPPAGLDVDRARVLLALLSDDADAIALLESAPPESGAAYTDARLLLLERRLRALRAEPDGPPRRAGAESLIADAALAEQALAAAPPSLEALREAAPGLLVRARTGALLAAGRTRDALAAVEQAGAQDPEAVQVVVRALGDEVWQAWLDDDRALAQRLAELALRAAALAGVQAADPPATLARHAFRREMALSLLALGDPERAAQTLDPGALPAAAPTTIEERLVRAESLLAAGDPARAFPAFRDLAAQLERAGSLTRSLWRAWRRMLEVLESQNAQSARTPTIRREIARLRALDPELGGGVDGRAIVALERRLEAGSSDTR